MRSQQQQTFSLYRSKIDQIKLPTEHQFLQVNLTIKGKTQDYQTITLKQIRLLRSKYLNQKILQSNIIKKFSLIKEILDYLQQQKLNINQFDNPQDLIQQLKNIKIRAEQKFTGYQDYELLILEFIFSKLRQTNFKEKQQIKIEELRQQYNSQNQNLIKQQEEFVQQKKALQKNSIDLSSELQNLNQEYFKSQDMQNVIINALDPKLYQQTKTIQPETLFDQINESTHKLNQLQDKLQRVSEENQEIFIQKTQEEQQQLEIQANIHHYKLYQQQQLKKIQESQQILAKLKLQNQNHLQKIQMFNNIYLNKQNIINQQKNEIQNLQNQSFINQSQNQSLIRVQSSNKSQKINSYYTPKNKFGQSFMTTNSQYIKPEQIQQTLSCSLYMKKSLIN